MQQDHGMRALDTVTEALQIEPDWSVRENRRITWWGDKLAQVITADPPLEDHGALHVRIHARIDLIRNPTRTDDLIAELAELNTLAVHSPLIWDSSQRTVYFHAAVSMQDGTAKWMPDYFNHICAMQAADAAETAAVLSDRFGGEICESAPPKSEARSEPDAMLSVIELVYAPLGFGPSPFGKDDFKHAMEHMEKFGMFGSADKDGLIFEIPFRGEGRPALMNMLEGRLLETVLVQGRNDSHPQFGNGLLLRATTPLTLESGVDVDRMANELNLAESQNSTRAPLVGAWCARDGDLVFVSFTPALMYKPVLLTNLCMFMAARVKWGSGMLVEAGLAAV